MVQVWINVALNVEKRKKIEKKKKTDKKKKEKKKQVTWKYAAAAPSRGDTWWTACAGRAGGWTAPRPRPPGGAPLCLRTAQNNYNFIKLITINIARYLY